ncbi:MAG: UDP-N-acetylmuramoyl-tripeptide--D-alanyl-D-alanine ligase [Desulfobacteraceae bacterium]|nr:MAG: UDP-N-acetylmuramoyl-tripeptide--D-alanyl-D-alanine ligase [Desulfobacteraceae bacterium]
MQWTIEHILKATGGRLLYGARDARFAGVGIDSRTIAAGQLFVAIRGETHDGHTFIDQVIAKGVRGLVVADNAAGKPDHAPWQKLGAACVAVPDTTRALGGLAAFQRNRVNIPVVAITGSNGKTSTRQMTTQVMAQRFNTLSTQGNFNNEIGLPLTLFNLSSRHEAAVLELGMNHPGELTRLGAICRPTIGVITNVGPGHLEFLGSMEGVARAKEELIAQVDPNGTVVLNQDDPLVAAMAPRACRRVLYFGATPQADVQARDIRETPAGIAFEIKLPDASTHVVLPTPGRFMAINALAAAAAGYLAGLPAADIKAGLESFAPTKGRLKVIRTARGVNIIDDTYNANPASMAAAFNTLAALRRDRPGIIIVGDMLELGAQTEALHRQVGALAAGSGASRLYAYGPHARAVLDGAGRAGLADSDMFAGSKEAIAADVAQHLSPRHWVLVKGSRGMAMETVVEAIRQWADRQA